MELPARVRARCGAEYGALKWEEKVSLKSRANKSSVSFGETQRYASKGNKITPALHLLSLAMTLDGLQGGVNQGLTLRVKTDDLPTTLRAWLDEIILGLRQKPAPTVETAPAE